MAKKLVCACWILIVCLCAVPAKAAEPSVVLPAFELVDSQGNTVAPVVGAQFDPAIGAFMLVRFFDPVQSKSLLFFALAAGPNGSIDGDNGIFPPVPVDVVNELRILYSNADCTGSTYINLPAGPLIPGFFQYVGTDVVYSAGRCESDASKICIYSAPVNTATVSANTASGSVGTTTCVNLGVAFRDALPAPEVIKINSPFPWQIK